jgi:hypothetical protein
MRQFFAKQKISTAFLKNSTLLRSFSRKNAFISNIFRVSRAFAAEGGHAGEICSKLFFSERKTNQILKKKQIL